MNSAGFRQVRLPDAGSFIWIILILIAFVFIRKSFGQVTGSSLEGPATLGKGKFEVTAMTGTASGINYSNVYRSNFGIKAGAGITDHFDLKVYFFRNIRQEVNDGFNVVQIIPKFGKEKGRLSLYLPVGIWQELETGNEFGCINRKLFFFSPRINGDILKLERFDLCAGAFIEIIPGINPHKGLLYGLTSGLGWLSSSLKWFLRTEFGIGFHKNAYEHPSCNIGCTIGYNIFPQIGRYRDITATHDRFFTSISGISSVTYER